MSLVIQCLGLMGNWKSKCQVGPYPWPMHLLKSALLVAVSGLAISGSLDQLGSCRFTTSHRRGQRLDFKWRYLKALISHMVWINGMCTMSRSVIFSFTWIITMIICRQSVILVRTWGVSCCTINSAAMTGHMREMVFWVYLLPTNKRTKVSMHILHAFPGLIT